MADDRVLIDCENFLQGNCVDHNCVYRHCGNLFQPRVVCKYWVQFMCIDVKCRFLHPSEEALVALQKKVNKSQITQSNNVKPTPLCKFFGRCKKFGCPFLHDLPEASVSRHPSVDSSSKTAVDGGDLSRSNSNSSSSSGITTTSLTAGNEESTHTVGIKRDRGVEILQRYSVTAIAETSIEETTTKKTKIVPPPATIVLPTQEDVSKSDFIAL